MISDAQYVLDQLRQGPRDAMQIISASIRDRQVGCTVHSRVADLRAQGYTITCQIEGKTRRGRERYVYRLVSEPSTAGVDGVATTPTLCSLVTRAPRPWANPTNNWNSSRERQHR